ncbi:immunoglobulin-like domain-containing protein [Apilactobacillus ozensis]|uniref:immunoglobulin-like domain-containing protein n=1 Tax=Apilactobacillus ozensis TaxID=866801 RepID=UPI0006D11711|nr:immunoglobulin-like domain-containing protein [Apilactobacillus ozensis]
MICTVKKTNNYNITLDGNVDTHKIGQYNLVYNYTDEAGNVISKNALVTVVKSSNTDENSNTDIITPNNINFKVMKKIS